MPFGISTYVTRLVESLPADLQSSLPTVAELEAELQAAVDPAEKKPLGRKPRCPLVIVLASQFADAIRSRDSRPITSRRP